MTMDSQIPKDVIAKRRRKRIFTVCVYSGAMILCIAILITVLQGGISLSTLDISTVEKGSLKVTVSSGGKVKPLYEEVITSPISSKVLDVYKRSGDPVDEGELILKLDLVATNTDYERLHDELEMKRSAMIKQEVSEQTQLSETEMQILVDSMKLQRAIVQLRNEYYLDSIGASTADRIRQAELEMKVQALQYDQLKLQRSNMRKNIEADMQVAKLDFSIAQKRLNMATKTIEEAQIRAPRTAVLTWVNDQIGSNVAQGAQLAIVADLSHFKVEAEIADSYADKISPGNKAIVEIGREELCGTVGNVAPAISDGLIKFTVILDRNDHPTLRSGLETDVYVVTSEKDDVLTIANRTYYRGAGNYDMWVLSHNAARKKTVTLGECNYDMVEVINGLDEGEKVIVNDMGKYKNKKKLRIKK